MAPAGSKLWRLAYRFEGKQKLLALGSYPGTSLARAREKRQDAIDPGAKAKADREERRARAEDTFSASATDLLERAEREGRAAITISKKRWLLGLAESDPGHRLIREITAPDILKLLRRLEAKGTMKAPCGCAP